MNIGIINYEFPPIGGGGSKASFQFARQLVKEGHCVSVLTSSFKGLRTVGITEGVRVYRICGFRFAKDRCSLIEMMKFVLWGISSSDEFLRREKPEVIISFFAVPSGAVALWIRKLYGVPYIVMARGGDVPGFQANERKVRILHGLLGGAIKNIWKQSGKVIANSRYLSDLVNRSYPKGNAGIVYNGTEQKNEQDILSIRAREKASLRLLYTGRMTPQKNLENLIKAFKKSKDQLNIGVKLIMAGDGPLREHLQDVAWMLGLRQDVEFGGWQSRHQLEELYLKSDIFVSLSFYEGMSNSLLEAMSVGLAVVASDIPPNKELLKEAGCLTSPYDIDQIAEKITELCTKSELRYQKQLDSLMRSKQFTWEESTKKLIALINLS